MYRTKTYKKVVFVQIFMDLTVYFLLTWFGRVTNRTAYDFAHNFCRILWGVVLLLTNRSVQMLRHWLTVEIKQCCLRMTARNFGNNKRSNDNNNVLPTDYISFSHSAASKGIKLIFTFCIRLFTVPAGRAQCWRWVFYFLTK